jgi:hypothetical protein
MGGLILLQITVPDRKIRGVALNFEKLTIYRFRHEKVNLI